MEELAKVIGKFTSIELLVAEIQAVADEKQDMETIEELVDYLEDELEYAAW